MGIPSAPQTEEASSGGPIAEWSAVDQARAVADRSVSARELLQACRDRYKTFNPMLNAVVVERLDQAEAAAHAADEATMSGQPLGPLHGVPVTVKEVFDWVGTPSTWGAVENRSYLPPRNAETVDRLIRAGANIWGKTNVPLHLGEWQTFNEVYGETLNPWDLTRTPGGSSGGSAVSLAMGFAGLELGSDIGGSIRFPSHYCGVFGHKPSFGTVSPAGHTWPGADADVDINVCGPMARSAADLAVAMGLLSHRKLVPEDRSDFGDFTLGVLLENPCGGRQDSEMTAVIEQALVGLSGAGVRIVGPPTDIDLVRAQQVYLVLNCAAQATTDASPAAHEAAARYRDGERDMMACICFGLVMTHAEWIEHANERERLRWQWHDWFSSVDLLLCPVSASAAPPLQSDRPFKDQTIPVDGSPQAITDQWFWAGIASGSYLPSTAVPVGQTAGGLPVGVQLLAPYAHDLRSIAFAGLMERLFGGFNAPPLASSMTAG